MKCFSLLILLFSFHILAQDVKPEEIKVEDNLFILPTTKEPLFNGDLTVVDIKTNLSEDQLVSYEGKRIGGKFYVVNVISGLKKQFEVFVLNPTKPMPQNKKSKKKKRDIVTVSEDFNIQFDKNRVSQNFIMLERKYTKPTPTNWWKIGFLILLSLFFLDLFIRFIFKPMRKNIRRRKKWKEKANFYIEKLETVKTREDFEYIYRVRSDINKLLEFDNQAFKKFYDELNRIQYKRDWTDEDQARLEKIFKKKGEVRFKSGI